MSIDRFATTSFRRMPRALWAVLGCSAAIASVTMWRHGGRHHHHCGGALRAHELHVELAPRHDLGELSATIELYGARAGHVHPLFAHPEQELAGWYDVIIDGDPASV